MATEQPSVNVTTKPVVSPAVQWSAIVLLAATFVINLLAQTGVITPAQKESAEKIRDIVIPMLMAERGDAKPGEVVTTEKTTVAESGKPTTITTTTKKSVPPVTTVAAETVVIEPVERSKPQVVGMTQEQLQQLIELFKQLFDDRKPKPIPNPDDPVDPIDPIKPKPGSLSILVSDKLGKPLPATTVEAGKWFRVSATGSSGKIRWTVTESPIGKAEFGISGNGLEYTGVMQVGDWIDFDMYDKANDTEKRMRLACNHGPQPPPINPVDPINPITPVDPKPVVKAVFLAVVHDVKKITPSTAIVLNATAAWNEFTSAGSSWMFYDVTTAEPRGSQAVADGGGMAPPFVVVYDDATKVKLDAIPLPSSVESLRALRSKYTGANQ